MNFLKSILWVPMVFGIIMGGLAVGRLIANGLGTEFVAMPGQIITAYEDIVSAAVYYAIELPFAIEVTDLVRDIGVAYLVFAMSNFRFFMTGWGRSASSAAALYKPQDSVDAAYISASPFTFGWWKTLLLRALAVGLGPAGTAIIFWMLRVNWRIHENRKGGARFQRKDWEKYDRRRVRKIRGYQFGYAVILLANPLIAAGLLWWNAAEIARLTAGIG